MTMHTKGSGLWFAAAVVVGLLAAAAGCGDRDASEARATQDGTDQAKPRVVATTTMIADLARQIGGDRVEVTGIMKPGEDPHVYDVRPRDAQLIAAADLVLMNGLHLEATLGEVIENNARNATIVRLAESDKIKPLGSEYLVGAPDPHCWFNVAYFKVYAERALDALIALDPEHADAYRADAETYFTELDELDAWVKQKIDTIPREQRVMVTSHDAFQYFGHRYDIDVLAVIGISTDQQARPGDLTKLEEKVRSRGVRALFIETSVVPTLNDMVRKVADATGVSIGGTLYSDSLGAPGSGADTYIGMVQHNTHTIVEALR